jgi:hypothetical protein
MARQARVGGWFFAPKHVVNSHTDPAKRLDTAEVAKN